MQDIIQMRLKFSKKRLAKFCEKLRPIKQLQNANDLCIYVTGSFGRYEASEYSDLDLFFVQLGSGKSPFSRLLKTRIDAQIIEAAERMRFPEFSRDGEFLTIHYVEDIMKVLGGPDDDSRNCFTARMLLLLESKPVFNQGTYRKVVAALVGAYFRDVAGHEDNFQPIFLVNDILRYWKTLCLNYEHRRNDPTAREKGDGLPHQIKNLKLKFSRMLTCFSTIAALVSQPKISRQAVLALIELTPIERLREAAERSSTGKLVFRELMKHYAWFLSRVGRREKVVREWLSRDSEKERAFSRADQFGSLMFEVIRHSTDPKLMRYLVI